MQHSEIEIMDLIEDAEASISLNETIFPNKSYEEGILATLLWLIEGQKYPLQK